MDKLKVQYISINNIVPYENNPRNNQDAIPAVIESIKQFGFRNPMILDKENVIVAGHTRYEAAKALGMTEVPVIYADDLSEEQVRKFRLVDNKTAEFAGWDFSKLEEELESLNFDDYDWGFNTSGENVDIDGLFTDAPEKEPEKPKQIQCPHCGQWFTP
jgi:ParB-like chromosome segregation protein Spo0J